MSYKEILHRSLNQKLWFSTSNLLIIRYNQWTRHIINPFTYNFRTDCVIKLRTEGGNDSIQFNQRGICCDVCSFFLLNASRIYFKHLFLLNPELFWLTLDPIKWKSNSIIGQNLISLILPLCCLKEPSPLQHSWRPRGKFRNAGLAPGCCWHHPGTETTGVAASRIQLLLSGDRGTGVTTAKWR